MEAMVSIHDLSFGYQGADGLFQGLNLDVQAGHIYGLFGQNGTGKTTLLKQIAGATFPSKGSVTVFGEAAQKRFPSVLQDLFLIPESFSLPAISARRYRDLYAPFYPKFDEEAFQQHLNDFGLALDQPLTSFSYGQQKQVLIGFALASRARLLLLDEPTNGLDLPAKQQFRKDLAAALAPDQAVVIATHQIRDLANLIDQVVILDQGQIAFHQSMAAVSENLAFQSITEDEYPKALYAEPRLSDYQAILSRELDQPETPVDLELLFNGVIHHPATIHEPFQNKQAV